MNPSGFAYAPGVGTVLAAARANARWRRLMEGRARPFLMTKEGADMADETEVVEETEEAADFTEADALGFGADEAEGTDEEVSEDGDQADD